MITIGVVNQKGGVGKTTTSYNLAHALALKGKKVLVVDFDPQASLTLNAGNLFENQKLYVEDLLLVKCREQELKLKIRQAITKINNNLDILPASLKLVTIDNNLRNEMRREYKLDRIFNLIKDEYDYVIVDSSPSLSVLTYNIFFACEWLLIPFKPEKFSLDGIEILLSAATDVKESDNSKSKILGFIPSMTHTKRNSTEFYIEEVSRLTANSGGKIFKTRIKNLVAIADAFKIGRSIFEHSKDKEASEQYLNLADEILAEIESRKE